MGFRRPSRHPRFNVQGVLCGHIHSPVIRQIEGTTYYNCGDWVENCSALVEQDDGQIELLTNYHGRSRETVASMASRPRRVGLVPQELYEKTSDRGAEEDEPRGFSRKIIAYRPR